MAGNSIYSVDSFFMFGKLEWNFSGWYW